MDPSKDRRRQAQPQPRALNIPSYPNPSHFQNMPVDTPLSETANYATLPPTQLETKVQIPRLLRPGQKQASPTNERQRVSHACDPCRKRKSKCDGLRPVCSRCRDQEVNCIYLDGKREKQKRKAKNNAAKVAAYEQLLCELIPFQPPETRQSIHNTIAEYRILAEEDISASGDVDASGDEDEYATTAIAGSPRFQDRVQPDSAGFIRTTGFLGKSSVVRWMEDLVTKMFSPTTRTISNKPNSKATSDRSDHFLLQECTYFLDDNYLQRFPAFGNTGTRSSAVWHGGHPRHILKPITDSLVESYFSTVHRIFPILSEQEFRMYYEQYYIDDKCTSDVWVDILHIVFAIGSIRALHAQDSRPVAEFDHVNYAFASGALKPKSTFLVDIPSMEEVQLAAISGLYYLASYHINRAWTLVGTAVRYGHVRALHLVNASTDLSEGERELESRVWHSISSMERFLCVLTGRPSALQDRFTSIRLPRETEPPFITPPAFIESLDAQGTMATMSSFSNIPSPNSSSISPWTILIRSLRLDSIIAEVMEELYSCSTVNRTWAAVQNSMFDLDKKLSQWRSDLPAGLLVLEPPSGAIPPIDQRMYLTFRFYEARILINRPCLCEPRQLSEAIPSQSTVSKKMDEDAAIRCLSAARDMVKILPRSIHPVELYRSTPWWCVLHYITQAGAILIIGLSMDVLHLPDETEDLINESSRVLQWLQALSKTSYPARRAYITLSRLLRLALAKLGKDNHPTAMMFIDKDTSDVLPMPPAATFMPTHPPCFVPDQAVAGWQ
ncbi:hypothetical protein AJ79_04569 [Helicocarpus griseus UAMH5409]|uniref:Zn(2)-C6 fungal-type domain-containing protein n=1 Tax=Helicocarpus griseus UAMH5409 TaxID=1447875 RepID=A0A2B7XTL6_9EURO|nr:hypothetical protein AJ79_04569 [Helicocarpus griseus UAMH5409]